MRDRRDASPCVYSSSSFPPSLLSCRVYLTNKELGPPDERRTSERMGKAFFPTLKFFTSSKGKREKVLHVWVAMQFKAGAALCVNRQFDYRTTERKKRREENRK